MHCDNEKLMLPSSYSGKFLFTSLEVINDVEKVMKKMWGWGFFSVLMQQNEEQMICNNANNDGNYSMIV